ncbi:type VI secretion system TssO [Taibaiella koreensis]|uniref:type VI secretion system TssO n=1 Tax=Taibaiella koreensis TaxID=1268548 RepID=UPI0013C3447D|nr:type VI secretion system TssO [Taibaiella koreensis]
MIALNKAEIRSTSARFWTLFGILLLSTLIIVYFFIWSAQKESEDYIAKIQENRSAMNKQIALQPRIDSLYKLMLDLDRNDKYNYIFLEAYIREQRGSVRQLIGSDSATRFSGYTRLINHLDEQILLQDTIIKLKNNIEDLRSDIEDCKVRNKSLSKSLIRTSRQ